jgi:hypothetical protein
MDSYVYLRNVDPSALEKLLGMVLEDGEKSDQDREQGVIRALALTTGEYDAVAFVEAGSLERIQGVVLERIRRQAGASSTETYIALEAPPIVAGGAGPDTGGGAPPKSAPDAPKRRLPLLPHDALINLKAETGQAVHVFWDLFGNLPGNPTGPGLQGEALTTGPWDILVELGANTHEDLSRFITAVRGWQHVVDSSAAEVTITGIT